jgi:2-polyprenyl-6-methoxyphenol hydroxylase-like FAD-dependent oxidoreductase
MGGRQVVVLGAGMAGLAAALYLARDGHHVTLVERDPFDVGEPLDAVDWSRRGISHFLQPHAFGFAGRQELARHLPEVYQALLDAGAREVDCGPKLPGGPRPGDEDIRFLAVRRPLIEWALRRAVRADHRIRVLAGAHVTGLVVERGTVRGAVVDGDPLTADLVVDAMGRRTPTPDWLTRAGVPLPETPTSDCGVVYYCRYYRQRPGFELPDGPWLLSPRGDLGYCAYATFPGDNRTFSGLLAVPTGDTTWRGLREADTFEAAVATIPGLRVWVDPEGVEPITDVLPMAGLRNTLRPAEGMPPGLVAVGDALGHTDPVLALGLTFSLVHAGELAAALLEHDDVGDAGASYDAAVRPELERRFRFATELDAQRLRMWRGEPVDLAHHDGDYALFTVAAAGVAAMVDPDVARVFARRIGLLDSTAVLDEDVAMQQRIEDVFASLTAVPRPAAGPPADSMRSLVSAHG